jgi:hypothetical protein
LVCGDRLFSSFYSHLSRDYRFVGWTASSLLYRDVADEGPKAECALRRLLNSFEQRRGTIPSCRGPVTLTGPASAVRAAVDAGAAAISAKGLLANKLVIPQPRPELLSEVI